MAQVRLNKLDSDAYEQAFRATFNQVKEDHPEFAVGHTLKGIKNVKSFLSTYTTISSPGQYAVLRSNKDVL